MSTSDTSPDLTESTTRLVDSIAAKIFKSPRKSDIVIWALIIWFLLLNDDERINVLSNASLSVPFKFQITFFSITISSYFVKFVVASILSSLAHLSLHYYVQSYLGILKRYDPQEIKSLLDSLDNKAGLKQIYPTKKGLSAINQPYSSEIMRELPHTNSIKILAIAGYEFIGKGEGESLFYDIFKERPWLNGEVILLDPNDMHTISERISQLKKIDSSYTPDKLKENILKTTEKLRIIKDIRNDNSIKLWHCKFHPIFRLIIYDNCLFMSTYEVNHHGHESPVYKFINATGEDRLSLYNSFSNFFAKVKEHSTPIL